MRCGLITLTLAAVGVVICFSFFIVHFSFSIGEGETRPLAALQSGLDLVTNVQVAQAVEVGGSRAGSGVSSGAIEFWERLWRTLLLQDYNTRIVVLGTAPLGVGAGVVGAFLLLRKRSLLSDALSHATLPGIAVAFMVMVAWGGSGKSLIGLLAGAVITGLLGMFCVSGIRRYTRLKDDAALGIVLSVFFGAGVALLGIIQGMDGASSAGLSTFIYGRTASITYDYAVMIWITATLVMLACGVLFKELAIICFDDEFAAAQGWPVGLIDLVLMTLVVLVTVIGLHAVGLILVIALLIIPPAAGRFWTDRLGMLVIISALLGGMSTWLGAVISAVLPKMPAGAIIVLVGAGAFVVSLVFGSKRGILVRVRRNQRLRGQIARQHLLRAFYECLETRGITVTKQMPGQPVPFENLLAERSWSPSELNRSLRQGVRAGLVEHAGGSHWMLTSDGAALAGRTVRNHRLWELYLITHAEIAPSHVDSGADKIEHVIGTRLTAELEVLLARQYPALAVPPSPHLLPSPEDANDLKVNRDREVTP